VTGSTNVTKNLVLGNTGAPSYLDLSTFGSSILFTNNNNSLGSKLYIDGYNDISFNTTYGVSINSWSYTKFVTGNVSVTNNLLVGTVTDNGNKLQVNGTATISNNALVNGYIANSTTSSFSIVSAPGQSPATLTNAVFNPITFGNGTIGSLFIFNDIAGAAQSMCTANYNLTFYKQNANDSKYYQTFQIVGGNTNTNGATGYNWNIGTTQSMALSSNSNLLLGTTTDKGAKLQVNGYVIVTGSGTFTSGLSAQNMNVNSGQSYGFNGTSGPYIYGGGSGLTIYPLGTSLNAMWLFSSNNMMLGGTNTSTDLGYRLYISGSGTSGSLNVNSTLLVNSYGVKIAGGYAASDTTYNLAVNNSFGVFTGGSVGMWYSGGSFYFSGLGSGYHAFIHSQANLVIGAQSSLGTGARLQIVAYSPTATINYGYVSLGNMPFDGVTSGYFSGSANGTYIAINASSSFAGNFLDFQKNGVSYAKLDNTGVLTAAGFNMPSASFVNQTTSSLSSGSQTVYSNATGSYLGAFYNYIVVSGSNSRAGQVITNWNGSSIQYTDNSTLDIGDTSGVAFTSSLSGANVLLTTILPSSGWSIRSTVNFI
jgi:hypothetical protein